MSREVAPVVGWRAWRWLPPKEDWPGLRSEGALLSCVWSTKWTPGQRMEASFLGAIPSKDAIVCTGSSLGFYAWRRCGDLDRIIKLDNGMVPVWGEVSLWGRVVECTDGWRGQYAYPLSFLLLEQHREHAPELASTFGVEARVMVQ